MAMPTINRQLRLQNRPKGLLAPGDLQPVEDPVLPLQDGQALARVKYLSIDPTMRIWMAADSYLPAVAIGEVMRSFGFAEIVERSEEHTLNSSHTVISYAVFCLKKKTNTIDPITL